MTRVQRAAAAVGVTVGIMVDLRGPKLRIGELDPATINLQQGQEVFLTVRNVKGNQDLIPVDYPNLVRDVRPGSKILLADGLVELKVDNIQEEQVFCKVLNSGKLSSRQGINLPGIRTALPAITKEDVADLEYAQTAQVDFVAASFVRSADDVLQVREVLERINSQAQLIAKIETSEAVENLDEIIERADAIMVARGDLGLDISPEEVPLLQKRIIRKCNLVGKPVITATQMLESMTTNPRPTRAEASDVANAILDGTDAVMLSGETAVGRYPVIVVQTIDRIARRVEEDLPYQSILAQRRREIARQTATDAISYATCTTANDLNVAAIITATQTGYTARMVAKYRPRQPIVAVTPEKKVLRQLTMVWGVQPLWVEEGIQDTDQMIAASIQSSLKAGCIQGGDLVVITAGVPVGIKGSTNLLKIHTVGQVLASGVGIGTEAATGRIRVVGSAEEAVKLITEGDILVAPFTSRDYVPAMERSAAVVTEAGGLTSHAAVVCLQFGIPVIVGVEKATEKLVSGDTATVDPQRGLLYSGTARVL